MQLIVNFLSPVINIWKHCCHTTAYERYKNVTATKILPEPMISRQVAKLTEDWEEFGSFLVAKPTTHFTQTLYFKHNTNAVSKLNCTDCQIKLVFQNLRDFYSTL